MPGALGGVGFELIQKISTGNRFFETGFMGKLILVRHGQASFGAKNYDQLSELGWRQSRRLGDYFSNCGMQFEAVITGTLKRHDETWQGIKESMKSDLQALRLPELNEYDSEAVIHAVHPNPLPKPDTPQLYRQHFQLMREGLRQWMQGMVTPAGMPSYQDFKRGILSALETVSRQYTGDVLLVSSGGPISTAVGHLMGTAAETTIELNFHIRNSAISEFKYNTKGHRLISFNHISHLDDPAYQNWITFT
jgi:broad specificity phosphatase PhoE